MGGFHSKPNMMCVRACVRARVCVRVCVCVCVYNTSFLTTERYSNYGCLKYKSPYIHSLVLDSLTANTRSNFNTTTLTRERWITRTNRKCELTVSNALGATCVLVG